MTIFFQATWMTVIGLSLLFVGGFVLWVYGAQNAHDTMLSEGAEIDSAKKLRTQLAQWFFLYGLVAVFFGAGCLVTAAVMII